MRIPVAAAAAVLTLMAAFAACGGDDDDSAATSETPAPVTTPTEVPTTFLATTASAEGTVPDSTGEASAAFNDADVTFLQSMIVHHEQAVEMADIALDPTSDSGEAVVDLAARIKAGQEPEIDLDAVAHRIGSAGGDGHQRRARHVEHGGCDVSRGDRRPRRRNRYRVRLDVVGDDAPSP